MERRIGGGAEPSDTAGVGRNPGLDEDDVHGQAGPGALPATRVHLSMRVGPKPLEPVERAPLRHR